MGRAFVTSYLAGEPAASAFFAPAFLDAAARIARARAAAERGISDDVLRVVSDQQAELPESSARRARFDTLAAGKAAVVVTGQQVGLFLGPLYSFYKAASAIAVARALEVESGVPCVPLFWLQTEDHDFEEIRTAQVFDANGEPLRLELPGDPDRISVAQRLLPPEVTPLLDTLAQALGDGPAAEEVMRILRDSYRPGAGLATAFASALATLFADEGLLIFNPRDARVATLAAPVHRHCIDRADAIEVALHEREGALAAAEFDVQVPIREQGALSFFHGDGPDGPRFRIRREPNGWRLAGSNQTIAHDDLLATLAREPLRFSTSALLRPILQDRLFPTAAYVAGPGEINYYAQLGPLYAEACLAPPLLVPRGRFRVVDARTRRRLAQLGLSAADLALPERELHARLQYPAAESARLQELRQWQAQVSETVARITAAVDRPGMSLGRAALRTRTSTAYALDRLMGKYTRSLLDKDEVMRRRLHAALQVIFPAGVPQERYYAWPALAGRIGARAFKELVLARLSSAPYATEVHELHP